MRELYKDVAFVRFFSGRVITNLGDSLYLIGALWLVHDLTGSAALTGVAGFLLRAPQIIQFLVGPLVDRWDLRRTLVSTQILQGVFVLAVPFASFVDALSVWVVLAVIPTLALIARLQYPAQSAMLPQIVEDDQLVRANSMFKLTGRSADIAFNAGAGFLIALVGATQLFLFNAVTFGIATLLFMGVQLPNAPEEDEDEAESEKTAEEDPFDEYLSDLREGITYLRGSLLVPIAVGGMIANFGSGIMTAVFPAFADTFGGPEMYGILMSSLAAGTVVGSAASWLVEDLPYGVFGIVGYGVSAVAMLAAVFFKGAIVTPALFFVALMPVGSFNVLLGSLLQSSVEQEFLGRVSSTFSSLTMLTLPVGSLVGGLVAGAFSPSVALYLFGGLLGVLVVYFLFNAQIRTLPQVSKLTADQMGLGTEV
ncbi:MAG: MFS transporter, partial [Halobaculum sp.]